MLENIKHLTLNSNWVLSRVLCTLTILLVLLFSSFGYCKDIGFFYFTPHQRVDKIILENVKKAEKSVYLASYSFTWEELFNLLKELKIKKKVDIKIFLEKQPSDDKCAGLRNNIKLDKKNTLFHSKFIIIDDKILLLGSLNFTEENFYLHHNNLIILNDRNLISFFKEKFISWWCYEENGKFYQEKKFEVYFSPENDCEEKIKEIISSANSDIYFAQFDFTSENIAEEIIEKKKMGINVYGIIEKTKVSPYSVFYFLKDFNCEMKKSNTAGLLHDKFFIIDKKIAIIGSYNPTKSAKENTECLIIIKDENISEKLLKEWKKLWRWYSIS